MKIRSTLALASISFLTLGLVGCAADAGQETSQAGAEEPQLLAESADAVTATTTTSKKFLSLGDSIAFGFNPLLDYAVTSNFIGYPEVIASKGNKVTNAGCPGETSGSFLSATAADNGCRLFKQYFALHADYETTQLAFAVAQVKATKFDFITVNIGANDLFLLQNTCATSTDPYCIPNNLPAVVTAYSTNLQNGYSQIKSAGYKGKWVAQTLYITDYTDANAIGAVSAMNNALKTFASKNGGKVADAYAAFQTATKAFGGSACAAGLLIVKADGTCDVHPSQKGRELLASVTLAAAK